MPNPALSLKLLASCWGGLVLAVGSGAIALQLTTPSPAMVAAPLAMPAPVLVATPLPPATPMPFQNHSLLAMLPPPVEHVRPVVHPAAAPTPVALPLPVPPVPPPPVQHATRVEPTPLRVARAEPPRRAAPVYVAEAPRAYAAEPPGWGWGRPMPYPGQYVSARQYYGGPRPYYGAWQPYD